MKKQIITISREYGSGGREIGRRVAEKLGYAFYDKELIERASGETGIPLDMIKGKEEEITNSFLYNLVIGSMYGSAYPLKPEQTILPITEQIYIAQKRIIQELADKGPCIFVGRCADDILKKRDDVLRIFIYADKSVRMERASKEYGQDPERIEEIVEKTDKRRRIYYNTYADREWGDYRNYDMILNSGTFGIDRCVEMICQVFEE